MGQESGKETTCNSRETQGRRSRGGHDERETSSRQLGDKNRKLKGRVVFLGDRVRDAEGKHAVFE